jgi:hypothetical protein
VPCWAFTGACRGRGELRRNRAVLRGHPASTSSEGLDNQVGTAEAKRVSKHQVLLADTVRSSLFSNACATRVVLGRSRRDPRPLAAAEARTVARAVFRGPAGSFAADNAPLASDVATRIAAVGAATQPAGRNLRRLLSRTVGVGCSELLTPRAQA